FYVYEIPANSPPKRLTDTPVEETSYADTRADMIQWKTKRCFSVSSVEVSGGLTMESALSSPTCVELVDTFPPAPPTGLTTVASEGAVSLIWDANPEDDLAGYLVLRGDATGVALAVITPSPIQETTFHDSVEPGRRVEYAVQAVDKAGNK